MKVTVQLVLHTDDDTDATRPRLHRRRSSVAGWTAATMN